MSWPRMAAATAAPSIPSSTSPPTSLAFPDLQQGFSNDRITILPVSQAIRASRLQLVDLAARLGRASDPHGSFANEGRLRSAYHTIFDSLKSHLNALGQITPIQIEQEVDLRAENTEEWDASGPVRALRAMFDAENRATAAARNTTSTSTETTATGTSRKSQKYGPCKPDLVATLNVPSVGEPQRYSAVGEFKFDREPPTRPAEQQVGLERNAIRDAQLLEGICQTIWYIACGGQLFDYRLAVLIINDGFKRFFRLDDGRIALEIEADSVTLQLQHSTPRSQRRRSARLANLTADMEREIDVEVLARGMHDAHCRNLCRLPNRILNPSRAEPEPEPIEHPWPRATPSGPSQDVESIDGFEMHALRRLLHFWAVALFLAAMADQSNAQAPSASDILHHVRLADESTSTSSRAQVHSPCTVEEFRLGSQEIARVGRLKHHWASQLGLAKSSKRRRGRGDERRGDEDDDDDDDDDGGVGGRGIRGAQRSGVPLRAQDRRGHHSGHRGIARKSGRAHGKDAAARDDAAVTGTQAQGSKSTRTRDRLLRVDQWRRQTVGGPSKTTCFGPLEPKEGVAALWHPEEAQDDFGVDVLDAETYAEHTLKPLQAVSRAMGIINSLRLAGVSLIPVSPEAMDRLIAETAAAALSKSSAPAATATLPTPVAWSPEVDSSDGPITPPVLPSCLPPNVLPTRAGGKVDDVADEFMVFHSQAPRV